MTAERALLSLEAGYVVATVERLTGDEWVEHRVRKAAIGLDLTREWLDSLKAEYVKKYDLPADALDVPPEYWEYMRAMLPAAMALSSNTYDSHRPSAAAMTKPEPHLSKGDAVRVRFAGQDRWSRGVVHMASANGVSLALALREDTIQGAPVLGIHPELGIVLALFWERGAFRDLATGQICEVERIYDRTVPI